MLLLRHLVPAAFALLLVPACETVVPPPPAELDLWKDAGAGVADPTLRKLCADTWDEILAEDPFQATLLGDPRFLDEVPRSSARARAARTERLRELNLRAGGIRAAELSAADRITHELLSQQLDDRLALLALGLEDWNVDSLEGPHVKMLNIAPVQPVATERQRDALVARWHGFASYLREAGANLGAGKRAGKLASRTAVTKTIAELEGILSTDPMDSPLVTVALGGGRWVPLPASGNVAEIAHEVLGDARRAADLRLLNRHLQDGERLAVGTRVLIPAVDDRLTAKERGDFLYAVLHAVEDEIYPALAGYRDVLANDILPAARADERCGIGSVTGGAAAYRTLIHAYTSLPAAECDPAQIHQFGLDEVARIRGELAALGNKVLGTGDVTEIQRRLRSDPEQFFRTRDEVEKKAEQALYTARANLSRFFNSRSIAACEVVPIPPHEEATTTIAYYRQPAADGSRPGQYFVNTSEPETRPRYEAEVLAYHESIPGHHLQIALAQELTGLPLFRRHGGSTAFIEGWALYVERLCDEMGLYSSDEDRLGVLSFDAWRAARLVVDTGIHALGWSRDEAIEYLYDNTLLARNNVENEVDRYIAWPGQALAYKIGQHEILALRDEARSKLGSRFSYPEFHDRILENGAVTLPVLRRLVEAWIGA
jgi:uncharacterized protein (DUF885 family)